MTMIPTDEPFMATRFANASENTIIIRVPIRPTTARKRNATLNTRLALLSDSFTRLSDTIFDTATGKPAVATMNINV